MKVTVLCNDAVMLLSPYFGEHGFSAYIEDGGKKILFDTGTTDIFIRNAKIAGINLKDLDYVVLSHCDYDHTNGLSALMKLYDEGGYRRPKLVGHPDVFRRVYRNTNGELCSFAGDTSVLSEYFDIELSDRPVNLTPGLIFLGEIRERFDFERFSSSCWTRGENGEKVPDYLKDDSALAYSSSDGIVIVTGCSHSGIAAISGYACSLFGSGKIRDIIGGLHLLSADRERIVKTAEYLKKLGAERIHPCHCTGLKAQIIFAECGLDVSECGSGFCGVY